MRGLLLVGLLALATMYVASQTQVSAPWARDLCGLGGGICDNPRGILIAAAALLLVYALARMSD
jgi:hypothetical protein